MQVNHFLDIDHGLDSSSAASFNNSLTSHLSVITVDALEFEPEINKVDMEKPIEARKGLRLIQTLSLYCLQSLGFNIF